MDGKIVSLDEARAKREIARRAEIYRKIMDRAKHLKTK